MVSVCWTPGKTIQFPGKGQCVVFLGKTLYSHSSSLHPGVLKGTGGFNTGVGGGGGVVIM